MKSLSAITKSKFEDSLKNISEYGYYMPVFSTKLKNAQNIVIDENYKNQDLRHSILVGCQVNGANFRNAVLADTKCDATTFKNVTFYHSNVEYCSFNSCKFIDEKKSLPFVGTNFSFSNFIDCELTGIEIANSTLDSVTFYKTTFQNSRIFMSTVENSKFQNCTFKNVELCDLNLCYSEFEKVHMDHVSLPFYQLPYVFGGLHYFLHTSEDVFIGPDSDDQSPLYPDQYKKLLPDLINYFNYYKEYFPIANIYISCEEYSLAYQAIISGIKQSAEQKDFRMLKFLCKLAADTHMFSPVQLQQLYDQIYNAAIYDTLTDFEKKNYFINLGVIRELLLFNDNQKTSLEYRLQTNIENTDAVRLGLLISEIENIISIFQGQDVVYRIELKHQCPWDIIYTIVASSSQIACIVQAFAAIFTPVNTLLSTVNVCIDIAKKIFKSSVQTKIDQNDQEIKAQELVLLKQQETLNQQQQQINEQQIYMNQLKITQLENALIQANHVLHDNNITAVATYHTK